MKGKRAVSILLLIVNVVLLTHAVLPHYHRNPLSSLICLIEDSSQKDFDHHDKKTHSHSSSNEEEECVINDACSAAIRKECTASAEQQLEHHHFFVPLLYLVENSVQCQFLLLNEFEQKPYLDFNYSSFITQTIGLRAPPCC